MIYLDYAATAPPTKTALEAFERTRLQFANPSSPHSLGRAARAMLEQCRGEMMELLEAKKTYDLVFTASATESNNMALLGRSYTPLDEILCSPTYHPSLTKPLEKTGAKLVTIPLDGGRVTPRSLQTVLSPQSKLLVLEHVNSQSGLICDIAACGKLVGESVHVHVDGSQSFDRLPLSLKSEEIDSLTLSAHKIGALRGAAALVAKKYSVAPSILGGGQEWGLRSGTENLSAIGPFCQCALQPKERGHLKRLKDQLLAGLQARGAVFPFEQSYSADHICAFLYPQEPAEGVLQRLNQHHIYISQTSACSSTEQARRELLAHFALSPGAGEHLLRISWGYQSSPREIAQLLQLL